MTSQIIRRFQIGGLMKGNNILQSRETHQKEMLAMMRDQGFVPLLDVDPVFTWKWIGEDKYEFIYTWQAVHVGEEKAWQIEGVSGGRMIPSTPRTK